MTNALVWFRQDLRLKDNPAFIHACQAHANILPLYIYDKRHSVLGEAQAWWLHQSLQALGESLNEDELKLILRQGSSQEIIEELIEKLSIDAVYWNRCYDPHSIQRDKKIKAKLASQGIEVQSFNGSLIHEPWTILNQSGTFFKVFTPYWKECRKQLTPPKALSSRHKPKALKAHSDALKSFALEPSRDWAKRFPEFWTPGEKGALKKLQLFIHRHLKGYKEKRNFPDLPATSRLSPHLHFGEISPWTIVRATEMASCDPTIDTASVEHFLSELGWREFSIYLLYHFPKLPSNNFKSEFDAFPWHNHPAAFKRWQRGLTGYPIVDAGMRELLITGYMHNRVRMIVASFLTKGLFIDWRLGADWFLDHLVDADLASNSASWQWVAGSGADAAPYFRIFNPILQSEKFDAKGHYIRRWLPELADVPDADIHAPWQAQSPISEDIYPKPMIDHQEARAKALAYYQQIRAEHQ